MPRSRCEIRRNSRFATPLSAQARLSAVAGFHKRKFVRTTDSNHNLPVAPNLLSRNFAQNACNRVWVSDITYIPTREGWRYLAGIKDLCSKEIVGFQAIPRGLCVCQELAGIVADIFPPQNIHSITLTVFSPVMRSSLHHNFHAHANFVYGQLFVDFGLGGKGNAVAGVEIGDVVALEIRNGFGELL